MVRSDQSGRGRPRAFELHMPGLNAGFFAGTEGWSLVLDILAAGVPKWKRDREGGVDPLRWLDAALASPADASDTGASDPGGVTRDS